MNSSDDTNLTLGDIREYDCTLGYRQSEVTVEWVEYKSGSNIFVKVLNNPLILTVNQSINNNVYTCNVIIYKNPVNCLIDSTQQVNVSVTVKGIVSK